MASILVKNIPAEIHAALKTNARRHHRSLNGEIIAVLEKEVAGELLRTESNPAVMPDYSEQALADYPPEVAARLRALRKLGESLTARQVDFEQWQQTAREGRR